MQVYSAVFFLFMLCLLGILSAGEKRIRTNAGKIRFSKGVLLTGSFLFAAYGDLRFALILGLLSAAAWLAARDRRFYKPGVVFAILVLAYFKYTNFFLESLGRLLGTSIGTAQILLPLGISFYTFSAISYIVDVHRGKLEAKSLPDVALYLSFFPKLTSGPIVRSGDFFAQMDRPRQICRASLSAGIQIFAFGLFKKIVLADRLSVFVNQVYSTPLVFDSLTVLLAAAAYAFQLYFDFSGYSDMAIGAAKMLNVDLPRNFNLPYLSHNVGEFWKRWHITLSSWLQDYLYIPLGGSRKGEVRTYVNLILTMVLGGLWHGASFHYVVWGFLNGLALAVHRFWSSRVRKQKPSLPGNIFSVLLTFSFMTFTWIFFRAETVQDAFAILYAIFSFRDGIRHLYVWFFAALLIYIVSAVLAAIRSRKEKPEMQKNRSWVRGFYPLTDLGSFWGLTVFFVFLGLILGLAYTGGSPFIYGGY